MRPSGALARWPAGLAASVLLTLAVAVVVAPFTPAIPGNGGPTSDGIRYAAVVAVLRDGAGVATEVPYVYRILPAAILAALPLETRDGFLLLNGLATLATGPLIFVLLRRYGVPPPTALLGVLWWAILPTTVRFTLHYPSTLDALGFALLVGLLLLALDRRWIAFGALLAAAILVRENTAVVASVLWLRALPLGVGPATLRTGLAVLPAAFLFFAVRVAPPVPPTMWWTQTDLFLMHVDALLTRADLPLRYLGAIPVSPGLFALLPAVTVRASLHLLRREAGMSFYVVATLALASFGGFDYDRFMLWLVPALAVLTFHGASALWSDPRRAAALTALHLLAVRFLWPMDADGRQHLAAWMDLERLALAALVALAAAAVAYAVARAPITPRGAAGSPA